MVIAGFADFGSQQLAIASWTAAVPLPLSIAQGISKFTKPAIVLRAGPGAHW